MKDTKLVASGINYTSRSGFIRSKRVRAEEVKLQASKDIEIGSSLEGAVLEIRSEKGDIRVNKKLGVGRQGLIETPESVEISSVYAMQPLNFLNPEEWGSNQKGNPS